MENKLRDVIYETKSRSVEQDAHAEYLTSWLKETPSVSTFRVNVLKSNKERAIEAIEKTLQTQTKDCNEPLPEIFEIFPDTIGVRRWPKNESDDDHSDTYEVIVDASCGAAVLRGAHVFAPGIMGLSPGISMNDKVSIYADISGQCKKGLKIEYQNGIKQFVGIGILKMERHTLFKSEAKPSGIAVETLMPASRIPVLNSTILPLGECLLQNLPSIICSKVLNPQNGEIVLDMCAAPGNKTSHLAEIMKNEGIIVALDKSESKVSQIINICKQHDISCVYPFVYDSTKIVDENIKTVDLNKLKIFGPPFPVETFDKILLDAPCSALGQRPLLKNSASVKTLKSYVPLQRKLFHSAVRLLKPSGTLVYSTCTITQAECESMVVWALKTFPDVSLVPAEPLCGKPGWETIELSNEQRCMVQRFCPETSKNDYDDIYNNSIGFFIAKFKKNKC